MNPPTDRIYVGYLPLTAPQRRFVRLGIAAALWLMCALSALIMWRMRDPGDAVWHTGAPQQWTGTLRARPYPMLEIEDESGLRTLIVVEVGKFGSQQRLDPHDGKRLTLSGWALTRDGREMIELEEGDRAITPDTAGVSGAPAPITEPLGRVTLSGEIVDIKCFMGAMKPGEGRAHKACAVLCIGAGIPPVLITSEPGGVRRSIVLTEGPDGPVNQRVLPFVAEPVSVTGDLMRRGDTLLISVERITPAP